MSETRRAEPNRLADETSPYLLQHAYNPVDWYAWGEEALRLAREQDKPIFLSIGYSACHWCHVMEHESFESPEIAELMNRWFINIKVDREERPDLDQIYMNAVVVLTGHGGWPMSVFLTPDLKPFFGGTYWPPEDRWGRAGFRQVLTAVHEAWTNRREDLLHSAQQLTDAVVSAGLPSHEKGPLSEDILHGAERGLIRSADRTNGGFGSAPKFPHPMDLRVLLRCWKRFGNGEALEVVRLTLDKMAAGGTYDHLGGGFHRYSTDARWLVPHFEKMLYDNALLVTTYLEAYQATRDEEYARVVRETLAYVLREMTQPQGGFYSTQDADSEGEEGRFFVWTAEEVEQLLDGDEARLFKYCYDVTPEGNWEGKNILNRPKSHAQAAKVLDVPEDELARVLERCRRKLFEARSKRVAPGRDDKVLASWNGLMIAAMAQAAQILGEPEYAEAGRSAADFILREMRDADGRLLHSYKDGRARFNAYLDDYACLIDGLVEVYQATFEPRYLEVALDLDERMIAQFQDAEHGGFYYTSADHEALIARNKDTHDNATPSGNGMATTALLRLARLCGRRDLEDKAAETLSMLSGQIARIPASGGQALIALDFFIGPTKEIVLVEGARADEPRDALRVLHSRFLPNKVVALRRGDWSEEEISSALRPLLEGRNPEGDALTTYVCEHGTCGLPVVGVEGLKGALGGSPAAH